MSSLAKDRVNINDCLISYSVNLEANKMFFWTPWKYPINTHGTFFIFIDHMTVHGVRGCQERGDDELLLNT